MNLAAQSPSSYPSEEGNRTSLNRLSASCPDRLCPAATSNRVPTMRMSSLGAALLLLGACSDIKEVRPSVFSGTIGDWEYSRHEDPITDRVRSEYIRSSGIAVGQARIDDRIDIECDGGARQAEILLSTILENGRISLRKDQQDAGVTAWVPEASGTKRRILLKGADLESLFEHLNSADKLAIRLTGVDVHKVDEPHSEYTVVFPVRRFRKALNELSCS